MDNTNNFLDLDVVQRVNWTRFDQFNLIYWNINSIRNKLYDIEDIDYQNNSKTTHFIALTETRILDSETDLFNIPNYKSYFSNRNDGHGGAALFVHNSLDSNLIASGVELKINFVIVNIPAIKTSIAIVYKKPTVSFNKFLTVLNKIFDHTNKIILIGDMNLDIQVDNSSIQQYFTTVNAAGCCILNKREKKFATRINKRINARNTQSSTIDHVITNNNSLKFNMRVNNTDISDHKSIFLSFKDTTNRAINFSQTENLSHYKSPILKLYCHANWLSTSPLTLTLYSV